MALRMTCPTERKGSENWHYRRRIPADVRTILAPMPKSQWPRNWYATEISISLGTADRRSAFAEELTIDTARERRVADGIAGKPRDDTAGAATHINTGMTPTNTGAYGIGWEDMVQGEYRSGYAEGRRRLPLLSPLSGILAKATAERCRGSSAVLLFRLGTANGAIKGAA